MKNKILIALVFLIIVAASIMFFVNKNPTSATVYDGNEVILYEFYGQGCLHCAQLDVFFDTIEDKYPTLTRIKKEVYFDEKGRELLQEMAKAYDQEVQGVPTIFIDDKVIIGYSPSIGKQIEEEIQRCLQEECESPLNKIPGETLEILGESSPTENPKTTQTKQQLTLGAVILAAVVDAINPCAFAVLIILLTTILAAGNRRKVLYAGLAFSLAIFISYFLMGLGLYAAISISGLTHIIFLIVSIIAILVGLFNIKDYFWYGKFFITEVPRAWRPKLKSLLRGVVSIPGAFFIGFVVSLFLLPCTSGPYIVILGLLAKLATKNYAITMLLLYNLIFILPMIIITLAVYYGFTTVEKAEEWKNKKVKVLHLIAGLIILALGIGMLIAIFFGYI
ncbi:MAG: cytochrome c biogenesis protein [Nanoarchaeota archaeon]|nr:cytochrome c biogenesis protein [Nanoarchaeota archaeon]